MRQKYLISLTVFILFIASCEKKDKTERLFVEAQKLEAQIIQGLNTISRCKSNYEKILLEAPDSQFAPIACFKLGKLNEVFGHYDEAVEFYQKLLTVYPAHKLGAEALLNIAQINHFHLDQKDAARETYKQVIAFYPHSEEKLKALLQLGQYCSSQEDWADAVDYFRQIVSEYPEKSISDDVCFRVGDILQQQLKDSTQAREMYELLLNQFPTSPWTTYAANRLREFNQGGTSHE